MGSEQSRVYMLDIVNAQHHFLLSVVGDVFHALRAYIEIVMGLSASHLHARCKIWVINEDESDYLHWTGSTVELLRAVLAFCWENDFIMPACVIETTMRVFSAVGFIPPSTSVLYVMLAMSNGMLLPWQTPMAIGYSRLILCNTPQTDVCAICLDGIGDDVMISGCGHAFHVNCIMRWQWVNASCPLCRSRFW